MHLLPAIAVDSILLNMSSVLCDCLIMYLDIFYFIMWYMFRGSWNTNRKLLFFVQSKILTTAKWSCSNLINRWMLFKFIYIKSKIKGIREWLFTWWFKLSWCIVFMCSPLLWSVILKRNYKENWIFFPNLNCEQFLDNILITLCEACVS